MSSGRSFTGCCGRCCTCCCETGVPGPAADEEELMRPPPCLVRSARPSQKCSKVWRERLCLRVVGVQRLRGHCNACHPLCSFTEQSLGGSNFVLCCCHRLVIAKERSLDPSESSQRAVQGHANWACLVVCSLSAWKCSRGPKVREQT